MPPFHRGNSAKYDVGLPPNWAGPLSDRIGGNLDVTGLSRRTKLVKVVERLVGVGVRPFGDRIVRGGAGADIAAQYRRVRALRVRARQQNRTSAYVLAERRR